MFTVTSNITFYTVWYEVSENTEESSESEPIEEAPSGSEPIEEESSDNVSSEDKESPPCGDVNADGVVNSLDAAQALKFDAFLIELSAQALAVADVNGDGTVNSLDAAQILKFDAQLITEF